MDKAKLLGELEHIARTMPSRTELDWDSDEVLAWTGHASAVMELISPVIGMKFGNAVMNLSSSMTSYEASVTIVRLIHQARAQLRLQTIGPVNVALGAGAVFDYFDEVRQLVETATTDLLFVDPYMGADFVTRYLPHVKPNISVRLLTKKMIPQLVPALQTFVTQYALSVEARSSTADIHDRWLFVDKASCYQSGASFKDGATKAPTTLTQLQDMFSVVYQQYETIWADSQIIPL